MSKQQPNDDDAPLHRERLSAAELTVYEERLRGLLAGLQRVFSHVEDGILWTSGSERLQTADESLEEAELGTELRTLAVEQELGSRVREAQERVRNGSFGVCVSCGGWIGRQRLRLVPYAHLCVSCSRKPGALPNR